jgi:alpha-N-acetylglucosaminidase
VERALGELLAVDPRLRGSTAYRYDLVDVARQVLANQSRVALPQIADAYNRRDQPRFQLLTDRWMARMSLLDRLLGTDSHFLFGRWQQDAAAVASSPTEAAALQANVRMLVTRWAANISPDLNDYARREWNGLVGDYYAGRWKQYFEALTRSLQTGAAPAAIDWPAYAENWARGGALQYPSAPRGDAYAEAALVAETPGALTVTAEPRGVGPAGTARVTATYTNVDPTRIAGNAVLTLTVPAGYAVTATTPTWVSRVAPGESFTAAWTVSVPADAAGGTLAFLAARVGWAYGMVSGSASANTDLLIGGGVPVPYTTVSYNNATFGQSNGRFSIAGDGADMWGTVNEFGAIYQPRALADGQAAVAKVLRQDNTSEYARAGLVVSNNLSTQGSGGYANIAVTPGHGCMFSWDANGNGTLDTYGEVHGFGAGAYVRLSRYGNRFTGACSSDGANWTIAGTAVLPAVAATQDVGMFSSAVNLATRQSGIVTFTGFTIAPHADRDTSADTIRSLGRLVGALNDEPGNPPQAANDGSRANTPYWGGLLTWGGSAEQYNRTWWQVDLGQLTNVSSINVRNYVDGTRFYTYQVLGSLDGTGWFVLGGKVDARPAADAGETFRVDAQARYVRIVGLSNSANSSFHLTEVGVYGRIPGAA